MMTMNLKFTHLLISNLDGLCNVCSVFSLLFRPEELSKSTFKKMPKASNLLMIVTGAKKTQTAEAI